MFQEYRSTSVASDSVREAAGFHTSRGGFRGSRDSESQEPAGRKMRDSRRLTFATGLVLLLATGAFLCLYVAYTVPPLIRDFQNSLGAQENSIKSLLTGVGRLALSSESPAAATDYLAGVTELAHIKGVIVTTGDNRIFAGAWAGDGLSESAALQKILHERLQSWSFDAQIGGSGTIFVAFRDAWLTGLKDEIIDTGLIIVAAALFFLLLLSIFVRGRLGQQVAELQCATSRIANGDYDVRVAARGRGPIADLTKNFNTMAKDLAAFTARLRTSEERFELAVNGSNEAIWDWDVQSDRLYLAPRFGKILGYDESEVPGMFTAWARLIHLHDQPAVIEAIKDHMQRNRPFRCEFRFKTKSGDWLWMLGRGRAVRDARGVATRMAGSFADISEQKTTEADLERERERLQVTLQSIADAVITTNIAGQITYMNPAAERLTGWSNNEARQRPVEKVVEFLSEFGGSIIADSLKGSLQNEGVVNATGQSEMVSRDGEKHVVEQSIAPLRDRNNQVIGGVIAIHDVSDRYKLMQQLSYQAIHDPLTQLANRTGFEVRLGEILSSAAEQAGLEHAICYMDMDQFKIVNDTCGHSAGDELLRQIAVQLKKHVRKGDMLARLGGDEFGLLLNSCPLNKALEIAEKIRRAIEAFRFSWEGKSFSIGVSIGLAPIDGRPGHSAAAILSSVDQACYIAKSKGRNRVHTYQPGDDESSRWHNEMQWVPHIHQAMDDGRFVLLAQPIVPVDGSDNGSMHHEILLRMKSANGDLISPGSFLPAAERYDLMGMLDRWVVGHAIDMLALAWGSNPDLAMSTFGINISGAVLSDNSLLTFVKEALERYNLPPELLCFEITETVAIANFTHAHSFVNELKQIGCKFALDDFGSGFASFSYLKTLPVDYLKIDGSFVRHLAENTVDHTMVDIINQLGHVMGLKTIAEFVENEDIMKALRRLGVDFAQGYHIGRPVSLHDVCYGEGSEVDLRVRSL